MSGKKEPKNDNFNTGFKLVKNIDKISLKPKTDRSQLKSHKNHQKFSFQNLKESDSARQIEEKFDIKENDKNFKNKLEMIPNLSKSNEKEVSNLSSNKVCLQSNLKSLNQIISNTNKEIVKSKLDDESTSFKQSLIIPSASKQDSCIIRNQINRREKMNVK